MNSKDYIRRMLFLSQLKKDYLESCLQNEQEPDYEFIQCITNAEQNQSQTLDLSLVKAQSLSNILSLLKCQNHIEQIIITSQQAQSLKEILQQIIEESNLDIQIRKKIPQLDLNQISSSSGNLIQSSQRQNKLQKSPSQYQFNTDRLQNIQNTNRNKKQQQITQQIININTQPKSPNTKTVNIKLKKQHTEVVGKQYAHKKRIQLQSHDDLNRKISSHSFTKHKNTSSSPINDTTNIQRQISQYASCQQTQLKQNSSGTNIQIKALLESQQSQKTTNTTNSVNTSDQNADISIHLKNLISFCNQSILKKNQECNQKKELQINNSLSQIKENNKENQKTTKKSTPLLKATEHTMIKLTELSEEDNPETARFNSEEDVKKLANFNSKGLQKLLQSKTNQLSEQSSTQSLLSLFQKK